MKITRDQLKAMIKECIVEVLNEGISSRGRSQELLRPASAASRPQVRESRERPFDPRLDTPVRQSAMQQQVLNATIKASAGGNSTMAAIFADTAATTLVEQAKVGDTGTGMSATSAHAAGGMTQVEHINGTPEEVFGEDTTSRWANLAFMSSKKPA